MSDVTVKRIELPALHMDGLPRTWANMLLIRERQLLQAQSERDQLKQQLRQVADNLGAIASTDVPRTAQICYDRWMDRIKQCKSLESERDALKARVEELEKESDKLVLLYEGMIKQLSDSKDAFRMCKEEAEADLAREKALAKVEMDRALARIDGLEQEVKRATESEAREKTRIVELAKLFGVCDGGRYLNDWITHADRYKALQADLEKEKERLREIEESKCPQCHYPRDKFGDGLGLTKEQAESFIPCEYCSLKERSVRLRELLVEARVFVSMKRFPELSHRIQVELGETR